MISSSAADGRRRRPLRDLRHHPREIGVQICSGMEPGTTCASFVTAAAGVTGQKQDDPLARGCVGQPVRRAESRRVAPRTAWATARGEDSVRARLGRDRGVGEPHVRHARSSRSADGSRSRRGAVSASRNAATAASKAPARCSRRARTSASHGSSPASHRTDRRCWSVRRQHRTAAAPAPPTRSPRPWRRRAAPPSSRPLATPAPSRCARRARAAARWPSSSPSRPSRRVCSTWW